MDEDTIVGDKWRAVWAENCEDYIPLLSSAQKYKLYVGAAKYGDEFQGDPLRHLTDEWLDMGNYLIAAFIERQAMQDTIAELWEQVKKASEGCAFPDTHGNWQNILWEMVRPFTAAEQGRWAANTNHVINFKEIKERNKAQDAKIFAAMRDLTAKKWMPVKDLGQYFTEVE